MPANPVYPGVYIEESRSDPPLITGVNTSDTAFVDVFAKGPLDEPQRVTSFAEFEGSFGGLHTSSEASYGIQQFFRNGGKVAWVVRVAAAHEPPGSEWVETEGASAILGRSGEQKGIYALGGTGFNLLCLPGAAKLSAAGMKSVYDEAGKFCNDQRAFLIVDIPPHIATPKKATDWLDAQINPQALTRDKNAAVYFPRLTQADPLHANEQRNVGPSGTLAGLYARTDEQHGVWKAPAGTKATLRDVNLVASLADAENRLLNPLAINALRNLPGSGIVCFGARTLEGVDQLSSEWKYIPVRRTALFIEESIDRGTKWVVVEPNDARLWRQIRLSVSAFLHSLFVKGAFQGATPKEAYFVQCDETTMTRDDIDSGILNIRIGFALSKPAEFIIIHIQQTAG